MIILDLSQVMISNLMVQIEKIGNGQIDENLIRHMILNTIRLINSKFRNKYGELVVACDSGTFWRRDFYPYYKAGRKKGRDESGLNWDEIFRVLHLIRDELKDNFPYRVIRVDKAEADDIIGTLCMKFGTEGLSYSGEEILIVSGDKDFKQLQKYSNVSQYDPVRKRELTESNPERFLKEHVLRGDAGDGVPNFLSSDNCLVIGERQKQLREKKLEEYINDESIIKNDERLYRNFIRNQTLIDFTKIPTDIQDAIMEQFESEANKPKNKIYPYFIQKQLKYLMGNINDF